MNRKPKRAILEVWVGDKQNPQLLNCLESPTDSEIAEQLKLLPGGDQVSAVELHISKTHHIAVAGSLAEGFSGFYREFSRAGDWETVREDLPLESAANLLASYRDQIQNWKRLVEWRRRAITTDLQQRQEEQEVQKIAIGIGKAAAFVMGLFEGGSKSSRKRRRK